MRDYIHRMKVPTLMTQATATDLTQGKASPYLFRTGFGSEQLNLPVGWYAYKKLGYKRAIVIALDHVSGREQAGGFLKTFKQLGGTVVNEVYAPLGTPDWAPYLTRLRADLEKTDFVLAVAWGADAVRLIKGLSEYGVKGVKPILAHGSAVDESLLPAVGDTALGMTNYLFYTPTADTPENRRFRDLMRKLNNKEPTNYHELGYLTAKTVTEAIRRIGGRVEDQPALLAELRKTNFEAPQGQFRFDEKQNVIFDLHIRRVEKVDGKLVNVLIDRIPSVDQFWTPPQ
jgi:branched-chain amino acid transport system substrate-binding protein